MKSEKEKTSESNIFLFKLSSLHLNRELPKQASQKKSQVSNPQNNQNSNIYNIRRSDSEGIKPQGTDKSSYEQILNHEALQMFLQIQSTYLPSRKLFANQKYVRPVHRSQAILYLSDIHLEYELKITTLLLAGNILDRFLCAHQIQNAQQLYCAIQCSAFVAMKIQEIYPPSMDQLIKKNDKSLLINLAKYEKKIIETLDFKLGKMSPYNFLHLLQNTKQLTDKEKYICYYFLELHLHDNHMLGVYPFSLVALAIDLFIYLIRMGSAEKWSNSLKVYTMNDVQKVAVLLLKKASSAKKEAKDLYIKYAHPKYESVSLKECFKPVCDQ